MQNIPGSQKFNSGGTVVETVLDGFFDLPREGLTGVTEADVNQLLDDAFLPPFPYALSINAFLFKTPDKTILVDAGASSSLGPTGGHLMGSLAHATVSMSNIDAVLLTHCHPDHIGGLLTAKGEPAFPNAELFIRAEERRFWTDEGVFAHAPDMVRPYFELARHVFSAYEKRLCIIDGDREIFSGVRSVSLAGHTPGHCGYLLTDSQSPLLIWGDIVHCGEVQLARPETGHIFDVDPALAVETRQRVLDYVDSERIRVAGMHLPFPGVGHIVKEGAGYRFQPEAWSHKLVETIETTKS